MTLYHVAWCPECRLVKQKLDELGFAYDAVIVPDARQERAQVHAVSGQYYVPVLTDGDRVLSETGDILSYLETTRGAKPARS